MKVLLVQPPLNPHAIGSGMIYLTEPLALETIAASIPHHEVRILDMRLDPNLEQELVTFQPNVVGVTAYTLEVYVATEVLRKVKNYNPNILTVVGGQHATIMPQDFNQKFIDVIVIGEGQDSFRELVDAYQNKLDFRTIKGLAFPTNGSLLFTQSRGTTRNLDELPIPLRSLTKKYRDKYFRLPWRPIASMMTSRGCPYRCNFCSVWKYEGGKYYIRSAKKVVEELTTINEERISIADDNFLQDYKRAMEIYQLIKATGIKKKYKLIARSDSVVHHPDLIEEWRTIGLEGIFLGLESFRDEELKRLKKRTTVKSNDEAIYILQKNEVNVLGQFIIHPEYTQEDFVALGDYIERMQLTHPTFSVLTPLPGTDLYEEKKDQLLTRNYEMFDLVHCVIPTKLPRQEFYQLYADLYWRCYGKKKENLPLSNEQIRQFYLRLLKAYELQ